jgi:hypothetical protein
VSKKIELINQMREVVKKRHRRTKAEMEEFRRQQAQALAKAAESTNANVVKKRHRRTKAEMEEFRRQQAQVETKPKAKQIKQEDKPVKKQSVNMVMKTMKIGEKLFCFGGYTVSKFDEKNLMLTYKGLFQGYFGFDMNGLKSVLDKIGMGIIFKEPKKNQNDLIEINSILMALDKFEKFLRSEFLCRIGDGL